MSQPAGQIERSRAESALRVALAQNPHALVAAIDGGGLFVDMPDTVPLTGHRTAACRSALDLVQPVDRFAVIAAWDRVKSDGSSKATVVLANEDTPIAVLYFFDVTPEHGVFLVLVVSTQSTTAALEGADGIAAVPTRLARIRKDEMAVITDTEPSVTAMLGWDDAEIVGHSVCSTAHAS